MALTPEEQLARNAGWTMPEGSDLISRGDDAIRDNARRARRADADTLAAAQQYTDTEIERVPTHEDIARLTQHSPNVVPATDQWRLAETDEHGNISRAVDGQGRTWLRPHPASPGMVDPRAADMVEHVDAPGYAWAITDENGSIALGVTDEGGVVGTDSVTAAPYDVILLVGQSNMRGQGLPFHEYRADVVPGIDQFPAWDHDDHGSIIPAADPLGFSGIWNNPPYTSMAMQFAITYRQANPHRRVLLVPAARGATAFSSTDSYHWDWTQPDAGVDLAARAIQQTKDALAAAGNSARLAGILWHQGEGDLGISSQYAGKLDGLMQHFRTELDAPDVPVVVGQMSMDRALVPARVEVDAAHQQTPARLERSAFVPSPLGLHNAGDPVHFSARALDILGERFAEGLARAEFNVSGTVPLGPENVRAARTGAIVTVTWEPAWSRVTNYRIEWRDADTSWTSTGVDHPLSVGLTATIDAPTATEVRVISENADGASPAVVAVVSGSGAASLDDSGVLDVASRFSTMTQGSATVRRVGHLVTFAMDVARFSNEGTFTLNGAIPSGFRPDRAFNDFAVQLTGQDGYRLALSTGGNLSIFNYEGGWVRGFWTYTTNDPMPD